MDIERYSNEVLLRLTAEEHRVLIEILGSVDSSMPTVCPETYDAGLLIYREMLEEACAHDFEFESQLLPLEELEPGDTFMSLRTGEVHEVGASGATLDCDCEHCQAKRDEFFKGL